MYIIIKIHSLSFHREREILKLTLQSLYLRVRLTFLFNFLLDNDGAERNNYESSSINHVFHSWLLKLFFIRPAWKLFLPLCQLEGYKCQSFYNTKFLHSFKNLLFKFFIVWEGDVMIVGTPPDLLYYYYTEI